VEAHAKFLAQLGPLDWMVDSVSAKAADARVESPTGTLPQAIQQQRPAIESKADFSAQELQNNSRDGPISNLKSRFGQIMSGFQEADHTAAVESAGVAALTRSIAC
jgi:hypothetical protein